VEELETIILLLYLLLYLLQKIPKWRRNVSVKEVRAGH